MASTILIIDTDLSVQTQRDLMSDSPDRALELSNKIQNFLKGCNAGARAASLRYSTIVESSDSVQASRVGTFSGVPADAETIAINGVTITFVDGAAGNNQVQRDDMPSNSVLATRLAAAINNSTTPGLSGIVVASADGANVTVTSRMPGLIGNSIPLADSAAGFAWASGGTALTGGAGLLSLSFQKASLNRA